MQGSAPLFSPGPGRSSTKMSDALNADVKVNSLALFEERVRLLSEKGPLLTYSFAGYVSGLSRARLRQLVANGTVETEKVNGQLMIVLRSLVQYRRRILKRHERSKSARA